jgi:hypothetical protein
MKQAGRFLTGVLGLMLPWLCLAQSNLTFQADSGVVTGPFVVTNGCIFQTVSTELSTAGSASYTFTITKPGRYAIQALVDAPKDCANSFYVNLDGEPQDPAMIWNVPSTPSGLENRFVSWRGNGTADHPQFSPRVFTLSSGEHKLIIRGKAARTKLARICIMPLPQPPGNLRVSLNPPPK